MYQVMPASDSGNQSAANSDDLSSNASSDCLTPPDPNKNQTHDDLMMNFRCLKRQGSSGNLLLTPTKPLFLPGSDPFTTPTRYPLRTSSSLSHISCVESSPAPTVKTVIDKSANSNNSPNRSPIFASSASHNNSACLRQGTTNRTLGDMEREMAEMQKTIVDLRLRLELYYEQSQGKFATSSEAEVRKMALALEAENRVLKEKITQLESDLQKALETYPQLVAELNAARSKVAYMQKQQQVPTTSSATWTDLPMRCLKCEENAIERNSLSSFIEKLHSQDEEKQLKISQLREENNRLNEALKCENEKFEKAKLDLETSEKANSRRIQTFEESLASLKAELEQAHQLRQKTTAECQKRVETGVELVKQLEALKRDLAAKDELLKTSGWELDDVKRRFDELEASKRDEVAILEDKVRSLTEQLAVATSNNKSPSNDECDLGLPRSTSSPVASTPPTTTDNSIVAQLFDKNKDAMLSAMGSELAKFAKQLTVRDKAILGLTKMLQKQNLQVAEEFKTLLTDLKGNLNEKEEQKTEEPTAVTTSNSQHTQVDDCDQQSRGEHFLKLLHVLQLSDDENALKRKIDELEAALQVDVDESEANAALQLVKQRIQVLEVASRFLNGEIALACSRRDQMLGQVQPNEVETKTNQQCGDCDALKLQCAHWTAKYRRLKKDFRVYLKSSQALEAGNLQSICKKCEQISGEYRAAIEQKDLVIEQLIADLANLDQTNRRILDEQQQQKQEASGRKSVQIECNLTRSRSSLALTHRTASRCSSVTIRPPSTVSIDDLADLHKYLPKLWKRFGKLRSFGSSLFTEQKVYEAVVTARMANEQTEVASEPTLKGDLKMVRTLGCRLVTALNESSALEDNVRALEKRCRRRSEKQQGRSSRCESVSPCRHCNCSSSQTTSSQQNFEMSELFAEIQTLKEQLQRAIMTNSALKTKLEEQVASTTTSTSNLAAPELTSSMSRPLQLNGGTRRLSDASDSQQQQQMDLLNSPPGSDTALSVADYNDNLIASPSKADKPPSMGDLRSNERAASAARLSSSDSPATRNYSPYQMPAEMVNEHRRSTITLTSADRLAFAGNQRMVRNGSARPPSPCSPTNGTLARSASSDLRPGSSATLYAVGRLEEFEHLKREIDESFSALRTLENKVKARLSVLIHQQQQATSSAPAVQALAASEALHLKELQLSASELRVCLNQQKQLTNQFSVSQLPPINARGKFVDVELLSENTRLIEAVTSWKSKYEAAERLLRQMQERLEQRNRAKEVAETAIYNKLVGHEEVLQQVRTNLQRTFGNGGPPAEAPPRPLRNGSVKTPLPDKVSPK